MGRMKDFIIFSDELDMLTWEEFENFVYKLIQSIPKFSKVVRTSATSDASYDFFADEIRENEKTVRAIFQVRKSNLITPDYIKNIGDYWETKGFFKTSKLYLVTNGTATREAFIRAKKYGIEIWDIYVLNNLDDQARSYKSKDFKEESQSKQEAREEILSRKLQLLAKGKRDWSTYQQLAGEIFSHLFSPPLEAPRYEHSDADLKNRRDMIFENSSEHSFWRTLREIYKAYYIVVDAKNTEKLLGKRPVIEIAHYLKPYGCGMFGILLTREGMDSAAKHAIKEQWIGNQKMIIVLCDADIYEMLKLKQANGKPEEIIRMRLADFRMSL